MDVRYKSAVEVLEAAAETKKAPELSRTPRVRRSATASPSSSKKRKVSAAASPSDLVEMTKKEEEKVHPKHSSQKSRLAKPSLEVGEGEKLSMVPLSEGNGRCVAPLHTIVATEKQSSSQVSGLGWGSDIPP